MVRLPSISVIAITIAFNLGAGASFAESSHAGAASMPTINASPSNVMVNKTITLRGTGFAPNANIVLKECASKGWIVPQHPCVAGTEVTLRSDGTGAFSTKFVAKVCNGASTGPITSRVCYVGEPTPEGIDTITLVGAAKIVVSYP